MLPDDIPSTPATFPVNLILEGRKCLVVGAGTVAFRKITKLLEAKAEITVISPHVTPEIDKLRDKLTIAEKEFEKLTVTLKDYFLVIAASNNHTLNKKITEECHHSNTLCCSIDEHWRKGSFITPASFRIPDGVVSISTEGKSCRSAKETRIKLQHYFLEKGSTHEL